MESSVKSQRKFTALILIMMMLIGLIMSSPLRAEETTQVDPTILPATVSDLTPVPLEKVGQGTFRKLGFRVYDATLWATQNTWNTSPPYALQLCYSRDISKDTLIDTVMSDIEDQNVADEETRARWKSVLDAALSDVNEGDVLVGLALPDGKTVLVYNGVVIASIEEQAFSDAFFSVWLGNNADEELRVALLGGA